MNKQELDLIGLCAPCRRIAIAGHVRPDGDAVGSCLGLRQYLLEAVPHCDIDVFLEEPPEKFSLLPGFDAIQDAGKTGSVYDLFISLDCADKVRLGKAARLFDSAAHTVCIDHHISNQGFAEVNLVVPDASSTSEVITSLMDPGKISKESAMALYLGIVHDTGVFRYSCTHPETMEMAARLMRSGIDATRIINETFYDKTYAQNQVLGCALAKCESMAGGKLLFSSISMEEMERYRVSSSDLDGIVQTMMGTVGAEVSVFLYELAPDDWKASMRSREILDVSTIAQSFGGGGHVRAAGCNLEGTLDAVKRTVTDAILVRLAI